MRGPTGPRTLGFALIDALLGLVMMTVLIHGLYELRLVQVRSVEAARCRLVATGLAGGIALLASLDPGAAGDGTRCAKLAMRLEANRVLPGGRVTVATRPAVGGSVRVTATVRYVTGGRPSCQEVDALATATR